MFQILPANAMRHFLYSHSSDCFLCLLSLLWSSWNLCVHRGTFSASLITHTYLMATVKKKKTTVPFHKLFFLFLKKKTQTQLPQWEKGQNWMLLFHLCLSGLLSHKPAREKASEKADGLSLWLHMNLQQCVAVVVKERSVIFHPL